MRNSHTYHNFDELEYGFFNLESDIMLKINRLYSKEKYIIGLFKAIFRDESDQYFDIMRNCNVYLDNIVSVIKSEEFLVKPLINKWISNHGLTFFVVLLTFILNVIMLFRK